MIRKIYPTLSELCARELYPRGFILEESSPSVYCGVPNTDCENKIWTKDRTITSGVFEQAQEIMLKASKKFNSRDLQLQLEGRVIPEKLVYDWKDLEVKIFEVDGKWALVAPDALYANRALITKATRKNAYLSDEKLPFPVHNCRIVLLCEGMLNDELPALEYCGALDLASYRKLLFSHRGGSLDRDLPGITIVRESINRYQRSFKIILDGFTRQEQYSVGLDPLSLVAENRIRNIKL
ncbi:MAG TPA: hypothetical protein VJA18_07335 [Candidatus Nanoarchaeia archaeon]|nr:hypothetical protein [Candidatus Nanoarchaeia archaeon]